MFERTFFITTVTSIRKPLFRSVRLADLFIQTMYDYRSQGTLLVHEFVLMPDHLHMLLTPALAISLERCLQFLKGAFFFRCSKELEMKREIWQPSFDNHRIRYQGDYETHKVYIHRNPVRARLVATPSEYARNPLDPPRDCVIPTKENLLLVFDHARSPITAITRLHVDSILRCC